MATERLLSVHPKRRCILPLLLLVWIQVPEVIMSSNTTPSTKENFSAWPSRSLEEVSEKEALLQVKKSFGISGENLSWPASTDPCADKWSGVICDSANRIVALNVFERQLQGNIPAELSNLPHLKELSLAANNLTGSIPMALSSLSKLESLDLSRNLHLTGNIPRELGRLSQLVRLDLSNNNLTGSIPPELGLLSNLRELILSSNALTGHIPDEMESLMALTDLLLDSNPLSGEIPDWLSKLTNLRRLAVGPSPFIDGTIPGTLGNLPALVELKITGTSIGGAIPGPLAGARNLETLELFGNRLQGEIPETLFGLANLSVLNLAENNLSGDIPPDLGQLTALKGLNLSHNALTGSIPSQLGDLKQLRVLLLHNNLLSGAIPESLGTIFARYSLMRLNLGFNNLTGSIPATLANLTHLRLLALNNNQLSGTIPLAFFQGDALPRLKKVDVSSNLLIGEVPLDKVRRWLPSVWVLSSNFFSAIGRPTTPTTVVAVNTCVGHSSGSQCPTSTQLRSITCLRFYQGNAAANCSAPLFCNAYFNAAQCLCRAPTVLPPLQNSPSPPPGNTGASPAVAADVQCLYPIKASLHFFSNNSPASLPTFNANINSTVTQLAQSLSLPPEQVLLEDVSLLNTNTVVMKLNLVPPSRNITFSVPERIRLLRLLSLRRLDNVNVNLETADVFIQSFNDTSPDALAKAPLGPPLPPQPLPSPSTSPSPPPPQNPTIITLFPPQAQGPVGPKAQAPGQKPAAAKRPKSNAGLIIGILVGCVCAVCLAVIGSAMWLRRRRHLSSFRYKKGALSDLPEPKASSIIPVAVKRFSYMELQQATDYFSDHNRLGERRTGNVFLGVLPSRKPIAVKPLELGTKFSDKEFLNEVKVLGSVNHSNCIALYGYCIDTDHRCLVFELMPNGSLQAALFNRTYPTQLTWEQFSKILQDVAAGVRYLHEACEYKIIHRELIPAHILLDNNFRAMVAGFGVHKDLARTSMEISSRGYMAPEFVERGMVSEKSDVYSFGVLMLVVITGHRPRSALSAPEDDSLVRRAFEAARNGQGLRLLSSKFFNQCSPSEARRYINVALLCVLPDPNDRPMMCEVAEMLSGNYPIPPVIIPYSGEQDSSPISMSGPMHQERGLQSLSSSSFKFRS